jgi:hypothetical protein
VISAPRTSLPQGINFQHLAGARLEGAFGTPEDNWIWGGEKEVRTTDRMTSDFPVVPCEQSEGDDMDGTAVDSRGAVKILNRMKLERSACECYGIIQQLNGDLGLI